MVKIRIICTGLLLLFLFILLEYSPVPAEKDKSRFGVAEEEGEGSTVTSPGTSLEDFLELLKQETKEPICDIFYEDFEGNGEYSAFVFTGEKEGEGSFTEFTGSLWYISREGILLLEESLETQRYNPVVLTWEEEKHLLLVKAESIGYVESFFWKVEKNIPLLTERLLCFCYPQGEDLIAVHSFTSEAVGGRIWQRFYLYWDKQEECYQEYVGEKISEEEFLTYENALQLQEEIEQELLMGYADRGKPEYIKREYIRRKNGVVNIQFYFHWKEDTDYYYAVLRENGEGSLKKDEYFCFDADEQGFIQEEGSF